MCGGIWITGSKFGVTWKLSQCAVKPPETFEKGKCYIPGLSTQDTTYGSDGEDEIPAPVAAVVSRPAPVTPAPPPEVEVEQPIKEDPVSEVPAETVAEPVKKVSKKKVAASV
jgi:hypothetical protein